MKVVTIVGTRPNFNKSMLMSKEFENQGIEEVVIHAGQHYDKNMSQIFFDECELNPPKYKFELKEGDEHDKFSEMVVRIKEVLKKEKPNVTLVYGDVNSTMAAAIASAKLRIPVAHIEGGVRSQDLYNAEEINRRVTDSISDTIFASSRESYENLVKENFPKDKIFFTGDIVLDSLLHAMKKHNISTDSKDYVLTTLHRQENVDNEERLKGILKALSMYDGKIIFPMHPRTKKRIEEFNIGHMIEKDNIEIIEPQGYIGFLKLLANSGKVLTDSGGVRREAYMLGKPSIIPIHMEWFPEITKAGWCMLTDAKEEQIVDALNNFNPKGERPEIFGDGTAHKKICNIIKKMYEK
jgi:UDP-GlcNAc3NAcA epimerase